MIVIVYYQYISIRFLFSIFDGKISLTTDFYEFSNEDICIFFTFILIHTIDRLLMDHRTKFNFAVIKKIFSKNSFLIYLETFIAVFGIEKFYFVNLCAFDFSFLSPFRWLFVPSLYSDILYTSTSCSWLVFALTNINESCAHETRLRKGRGGEIKGERIEGGERREIEKAGRDEKK